MWVANRSAFLKHCFCTRTNEHHWHSPRTTFTEKGFYCFKMSSSLSCTVQDLIPAFAGSTPCTHTRNDYITFERNSKSQVQLTSLHRSRSLQLALLSVVQSPAHAGVQLWRDSQLSCQRKAAVQFLPSAGVLSKLWAYSTMSITSHNSKPNINI